MCPSDAAPVLGLVPWPGVGDDETAFDLGAIACSEAEHDWVGGAVEVIAELGEEVGSAHDLGVMERGEPMWLLHEVESHIAERVEVGYVLLADPRSAEAVRVESVRETRRFGCTDLVKDASLDNADTFGDVRDVLLAELELHVEELIGFALEVVSGSRAWEMAAVIVRVVQEELHGHFAVGELALFVSVEEVDLAEGAAVIVDDLHTDLDHVDLAHVGQPVVHEVLEVAPDSMLSTCSQERIEVVGVYVARVERHGTEGAWVVNQRRRCQHPLEVEERLRCQLVTASGFGA